MIGRIPVAYRFYPHLERRDYVRCRSRWCVCLPTPQGGAEHALEIRGSQLHDRPELLLDGPQRRVGDRLLTVHYSGWTDETALAVAQHDHVRAVMDHSNHHLRFPAARGQGHSVKRFALWGWARALAGCASHCRTCRLLGCARVGFDAL